MFWFLSSINIPEHFVRNFNHSQATHTYLLKAVLFFCLNMPSHSLCLIHSCICRAQLHSSLAFILLGWISQALPVYSRILECPVLIPVAICCTCSSWIHLSSNMDDEYCKDNSRCSFTSATALIFPHHSWKTSLQNTLESRLSFTQPHYTTTVAQSQFVINQCTRGFLCLHCFQRISISGMSWELIIKPLGSWPCTTSCYCYSNYQCSPVFPVEFHSLLFWQ